MATISNAHGQIIPTDPNRPLGGTGPSGDVVTDTLFADLQALCDANDGVGYAQLYADAQLALSLVRGRLAALGTSPVTSQSATPPVIWIDPGAGFKTSVDPVKQGGGTLVNPSKSPEAHRLLKSF